MCEKVAWEDSDAASVGSPLIDIELLDELLELLFGVDLDALGIQGPGQLGWVLLIVDAGNLCGRESHNLQALECVIYGAPAHRGFLLSYIYRERP